MNQYSNSTEFYDNLSVQDKRIVDEHKIAHDDVISIHGILRRKLTKYDTPEIIEARYITSSKSGNLKMEDISRETLDEIYQIEHIKMDNAPKDKMLYIITGHAGGGKGTVARQLGLDKTCYMPDADNIKMFLPGYDIPGGADYVHNAAVSLNTEMINEALSKGVNTVVQTTGWEAYVDEIIAQAKKNGYKDIKLIHVDITAENAIKRATTRFEETGRCVDPAFNTLKDSYISKVVENFNKPEKGLTELIVYDNNGSEPVRTVVYSMENGLEVPTTIEDMKTAIQNAANIDELRILRDGIKDMPSDVHRLYVQKEQELRNNLNPVQKSMVDFAKMNELEGVDQFMARKFKLPIEKFKTIEEYHEYCKKMVDEIAQKDYLGKNNETRIQRAAMIKDWYDYVTKENDAYTDSIALMIMSAITSNLKPNEDTLPPVLNKGVLAKTVEEIQTELKKDPKVQLNFEKKYRINLQKSMLAEETALDESLNGWIVIPSKAHDPENFEANVDKLKMLSHNSWCTKSTNAEPYLAEGDFHVYMENGKPKLGVRFKDDEIQEIQGELNNSRIPMKHSDIAMEHIKEYKLADNAKEEVNNLEKVKENVEKFKAEKFPNGIENASALEILEACGIKCRKDKDGYLIISHFAEPEGFHFADLGIDERSFLDRVKIIEGNLEFDDGFNTSWLANLEKVSGNLEIGYESFGYHFPKLKEIGGDLIIKDDYTNSLHELQKVGGNLIIKSGAMIKEFVNLEEVGGDLNIRNTEIESLGILKKIGGDAKLNTTLKDMGLLEEVGGDVDLIANRELYTLKNLRRIDGNLYLDESEVHDIGQLDYVDGDVFSNDYLDIDDFKNNNVVIKGNCDGKQYNDDEDAFWNDIEEIAVKLDKAETQKKNQRTKQAFDDYSDIFPDELDLFNEDPLYDDWGGGRRPLKKFKRN